MIYSIIFWLLLVCQHIIIKNGNKKVVSKRKNNDKWSTPNIKFKFKDLKVFKFNTYCGVIINRSKLIHRIILKSKLSVEESNENER